MSLRILTAGESHGPSLSGIIEGLPAGLKLDREAINAQLARRQRGYGRGSRMAIEKDEVQISTGLRFGITTGAPLTLVIENRDWANWETRMNRWEGSEPDPMTVPRPGHADLAGAIKYDQADLRNILERASARETAMRTAIGAVCRQLLAVFDMEIISQVTAIGGIGSSHSFQATLSDPDSALQMAQQASEALSSEVGCSDSSTEAAMKSAIDRARETGDSLGGRFEVAALNVPAGLGSHVHWDRRLDAKLAGLFMSIPAVKSVENGVGCEAAHLSGRVMHDAIHSVHHSHPVRPANRAGGIEGGISNGQPVVFACSMKAIPTLTSPLDSVDWQSSQPAKAHKERSDVCAVPAAAVVGEAMLAMGLAEALCQRLGHDSMKQMTIMWKQL